MNNKTSILSALSIWAALLLAWPSMAVAQPTTADFQQAVAAYQQALTFETREKVIKMAAAMDQLPPIPEEARRHFVMGQTMFKSAKSPNDFRMATDEFLQSVRLAPWWPEALYNSALGGEAQGDYGWAISTLKDYLLFKLPEAEARAAQDKIYALEAKQQLAAQEAAERAREQAAQKAVEDQRAQQEAAAANKAREQEEFLRKINGARYIGTGKDDWWCLTVLGDTISLWDHPSSRWEQMPGATFKIEGRTFHSSWGGGTDGVITDDGSTITFNNPHLFHEPDYPYSSYEAVFKR